jgi:hypothetical protein
MIGRRRAERFLFVLDLEGEFGMRKWLPYCKHPDGR